MKKNLARIALAFFGFAVLAISAKSEVIDQVIIKIPYEFVVAGKTLPAGTYRVSRVSDSNNRELVLRSCENRAGVILLPSEVDDVRSDKPSLTFQQVGDQHFLSKIETADHVFVIPVSEPAAVVAAVKSQQGQIGSGSSGAN